jgi:hypothetical protein
MTRRLLTLTALGALLAAGIQVAAPADAMPLDRVVTTIRDAGGHYRSASASLSGADCSGLVSVAQSLATGQPVRRLGNTRSMLAGQWPGVIRGASQDDVFVIGVSPTHMTARIQGVNLEARQSGEAFRFGPRAASPWHPQFVAQFHVDERLLAL